MTIHDGRRWRTLVFAAAAVIALAGCEQPTGGYERLSAEPEASLLYPGSQQLADGGYDAERTIDGYQPAGLWVISGHNASIDEIRAFYEQELTEAGWELQPSSRSTSELEAHRWHRGDLAFRLGILDPDEWALRIEASDRFATLYEIRLSDSVERDR